MVDYLQTALAALESTASDPSALLIAAIFAWLCVWIYETS